MKANPAPLIVLTGPTASGKTSLAVKLASRFNGEIISADSRAIYKHMDIGTAKPTVDEQQGVPHHGLDLVEPGERFTAADFKSYTETKIDDIRSRGRVPFLVGGTGLYVDAVIFDYQFSAGKDSSLRNSLEDWTVEELQDHCKKLNIALPENSKNKRYLIRAIERKGISGKGRSLPIPNTVVVGIATDREVLRTRIESRVEQFFEDGVVEEAIMLGKKYGWGSEAMTGNIYRIIKQHLDGALTFSEMMSKVSTADWRLAKRQLTWMKRNRHIKWFTLPEAETYLTQLLANE